MQFGKTLESIAQSPLELALLQQVATFGMTTRLVWSQAAELKEFPSVDIARALRRLSKAHVLEAHPLHHGRFYFTLTRAIASTLEAPNCTGGPFSELSKTRVFAKLMLGGVYLPGMTPIRTCELARRIGEGLNGFPDAFLVHSASKQLALVRIDVRPAQPPSRIAQQLRQDVFRLARTPALKELVRRQQLKLAVAAGTPRRCQTILDHFRGYDRVGNVPVQAIAIPELLPLLLPVALGGVITSKKI